MSSSPSFIDRYRLTSLLRYIRPRNLDIYQEVFVHRSLMKQGACCTNILRSNERLEFLGDVVLGLAVTDYLYDKYPDHDEGFLTKLRVKIVKGTTLATFARQLGMEQFIQVSNSTCINNNIIENAFEALVGAIYLDFRVINDDMKQVKQFVFGILKDMIDWNDIERDDNFKDILMRYTQKYRLDMPRYKVEHMMGQPHRPVYTVSVTVNDRYGKRHAATHESTTKREAEQLCARTILVAMNIQNTAISWKKPRTDRS